MNTLHKGDDDDDDNDYDYDDDYDDNNNNNRPDIIIKNKKEKTCTLIHVAIPANRKIEQKKGSRK
jgi:hypothetical protein